ncbi:carbohydrate-binding family 9-like protein [bacterium]|nr:carbohydrate-binding family 9-like protein [bacterium]
MSFVVKKIHDFDFKGDGSAPAWDAADWLTLKQGKGPDTGYSTGVKLLYSKTGVYILFHCKDRRLSVSYQNDFMDLWHEDVVEVFFWPDERHPLYFEYQLSPLNRELVLLVPHIEGRFFGWRPWHYKGERRVRHAVAVKGGPGEPGSSIDQWTAEIYIPFDLLKPLLNGPPVSGTRWRANFYRCDYDSGAMTYLSWMPVDEHFHEFRKFGEIYFD